MADAVLTGVETRTSSPLRMTRGTDRQSLNVRGLYPAGEGAGYAGGIMSAAVDGIEAAEEVAVGTDDGVGRCGGRQSRSPRPGDCWSRATYVAASPRTLHGRQHKT